MVLSNTKLMCIYTVFARNNVHIEIMPMPIYTPMCDRSELSARKTPMPNYTPMPKYKPRIRMLRQNKMGPQNICLRLCAFDKLVLVLSKSAYC